MNTFATICGWTFLVAIGVTCAFWAIAGAFELRRRSLERFEWAIADKTRHELGRSLGFSSHWFGESRETALAIHVLADRLVHGRSADPSDWRDEWRAALKKAPECPVKRLHLTELHRDACPACGPDAPKGATA